MIELNPVFKPILDTDKRYILVTGGRNSAKSFAVNTIACLLSYEIGHLFLHTRYAMTTAKDSIIPEFREKIDLLDAQRDFLIQKTEIFNKVSGSQIMFRGIRTASGDQTANLKSIQGLSDWILEEAEELTDEKKFDTIDLSVRNNRVQNRVILIMNPTTKDHWIWKRWFENHLAYIEIDGFQIPVSAHPDVLHIHTTYLDNLKHIDPKFLAALLKIKETNPEKYKHVVLGGWLEKAEGVIFENWEEGKFDERLPYCYGLDFGYSPDPTAMIRVAVDRKANTIYLQQALYKTKMSTASAVKEVKNALLRPHDMVVCDTSEPRLFAELRLNRVNAKMASKRGKIIHDIRDMNDYRIVVDPGSFDLKRELNNYAWNDKLSDTPKDDYNHLIDAARYAFRRLVGFKGSKGIRQL